MKKVAYDLHGVIDSEPESYKSVMKTLYNTPGIQIWVISGSPAKDIIKQLSALGIESGVHYHVVASVVDYLISKGHDYTIDENGEYWFNSKVWWESKAMICKENNVFCLTDDHAKYGEFFTNDHPTNFILKQEEAPIV